jgi:hypothetical protein
MRIVIIVCVLLAALLFYSFRVKAKYNKKILSDLHYQEVAAWAVKMLGKHPVDESTTSTIDDGERVVHFSVSQRGRPTTHAVGNRMTYLLQKLLDNNACKISYYRTQTMVHLAVFTMPQDQEWQFNAPKIVVGEMKHYQPLTIPTIDLPL